MKDKFSNLDIFKNTSPQFALIYESYIANNVSPSRVTISVTTEFSMFILYRFVNKK